MLWGTIHHGPRSNVVQVMDWVHASYGLLHEERGGSQGKTCEQEMGAFLEGRKTEVYREGFCGGRASLSEEVETEPTSRQERKGRSWLSP